MDWNRVRLAAAVGPLAVLLAVAPALGDDLSPPGGSSRPTRVLPSEDKAERSRPDALTSARRRGRLTQAEYSLERARSLFSLGAVRDEYGRVRRPNSHAATLILRDLALSLNRLSGAGAREARRLLARPTDGSKDPGKDGYTVGKNKQEHRCFKQGIGGGEKFPMCLHWVTASSDKAKPSYVNKAEDTLRVVAALELNDFGFRTPRSDGESKNHGPNKDLDIYLADLGGQGVYGYCTTDQPKAIKERKVSAFCVLDNDYSPEQFDAPPPEVNGTKALKITTAHEFFHAVQFAYDWREARWLMEGSAIAMEDEIYDGIDAALAFIEDGPMHQPEIPLDAFSAPDDGENFEYGAWLFFRYLSENYCRFQQFPGPYTFCTDPELVRLVFVEAAKDGVTALEAIKQVIQDNTIFTISTFPEAFTIFGVWNYVGNPYYEEGSSYQMAVGNTRPPLDALYDLEAESSETGSGQVSIDHLATRYVVFRPGTSPGNGPPNDAKITIEVDLPDKAGGTRVMVLFNPGFGADFITLDNNGNGTAINVPFDRSATYTEVILVLSNAGNADNQVFKYTATAEELP